MLQRNQPKYLGRKSFKTLVTAKSPAAMKDARTSIYTMGGYSAAGKLPKDRRGSTKAVSGYGGNLNVKGIPTFASSKYGSGSEPGVYASGRRAKPTGFGRFAGLNTPPVGTKQVVKHRNGTAFWHGYGRKGRKAK
jgi:hypothetical protein